MLSCDFCKEIFLFEENLGSTFFFVLSLHGKMFWRRDLKDFKSYFGWNIVSDANGRRRDTSIFT